MWHHLSKFPSWPSYLELDVTSLTNIPSMTSSKYSTISSRLNFSPEIRTFHESKPSKSHFSKFSLQHRKQMFISSSFTKDKMKEWHMRGHIKTHLQVNRHASLNCGRQRRNTFRRQKKSDKMCFAFVYENVYLQRRNLMMELHWACNTSIFLRLAKVPSERLRNELGRRDRENIKRLSFFSSADHNTGEVNHRFWWPSFHGFCGNNGFFSPIFTPFTRLMKFRIRTPKWNNEYILNISYFPFILGHI